MFILKAFANHSDFTVNLPGVNGRFGELFPYSYSYSREIGRYSSDAMPRLELVTFTSSKDGAAVGLSPALADHVLGLANLVYYTSLNTPGVIAEDQFRQALLTNTAGTVKDVLMGEITSDGHYLPDWVSWTSTLAAAGENRMKVWFRDQAFAVQYDETEIVITPPCAPTQLDRFFGTGVQVKHMLAERTLAQTVDLMQQAKEGKPETVFKILSYDYIDPQNPTHKETTNWGVLIYGLAGNNVDSIKDALVNFILARSTRTREQWGVILPDLFKRTEFMLAPLWDQYAIPNRTVEAGIYSPIVTLAPSVAKLKALVPAAPAIHVDNYASAICHPYKSLQILAISGVDNRDNVYKLTDVVPDYIAVPSTSIDFNRQSVSTQAWSLILEELLIAAETATPQSSVPVGMSRITRDGKLFLVKAYRNTHYLVLTKYSATGGLV